MRIKDITFPRGVREYQLIGYGLVVGLQGTGDTLRNAPFTEQSVSSMLDRLGVNVRNSALRTRNLAAVMVTASLPPFVGWGSTIDVTVSAMGDATSLMGGTLILTSLTGVDGNVYAIAQGPIAVSGFAVGGPERNARRMASRRSAAFPMARPSSARRRGRPAENGALVLELRNPDFETAVRIADAINRYHAGTLPPAARARTRQSQRRADAPRAAARRGCSPRSANCASSRARPRASSSTSAPALW